MVGDVIKLIFNTIICVVSPLDRCRPIRHMPAPNNIYEITSKTVQSAFSDSFSLLSRFMCHINRNITGLISTE